MYKLLFKSGFEEGYRKLTKNNNELKKRVLKTLKLLSEDPLYPSLRSHKVNTKEFTNIWSSWVTGDIRIIWRYHQNVLVIELLSIGGHSGRGSVYK